MCVCGALQGSWRYLPPACILLRLQFIHVTDMTEPVALAPGSPQRFLGGHPGRCVSFIQSQVGVARPWMCFCYFDHSPPPPSPSEIDTV